MISSVFYTIFYEPLLNGLIFLIEILPFHSVGLAVIILTIIVRFIILPLNHKAIVVQNKIKQIEPEIKDIKEKFKKDSQEQAKKIMELYRKHGVNPFSGFITLIFQIPIFFAFYKIFAAGLVFDPSHIYSFISLPDQMGATFLGFFDMTENSYILAFLTGFTQFFQMKLALPPIKSSPASNSFKDNLARNMSLQMRYVMPVFIIFIAARFPAALALYWTTMNIFAIVHESIVRKKSQKIMKQDENGKTNTNNKIINRNNS